MACASQQTVVVWHKQGAVEGELEAAREECLAAPGAQALQLGVDRIEAELRGNAFQTCMRERGWTWTTEAAPAR